MSKKSKKNPDALLEAKGREVARRKDEVSMNARHFVTAVLEDKDIKALRKSALTVGVTAAVGLAVGAILGRTGRGRSNA